MLIVYSKRKGKHNEILRYGVHHADCMVGVSISMGHLKQRKEREMTIVYTAKGATLNGTQVDARKERKALATMMKHRLFGKE